MLCLFIYRNCASQFWFNRIGPGELKRECGRVLQWASFFSAHRNSFFTIADFFSDTIDERLNHISKRKGEFSFSSCIDRQHVMFIHINELRRWKATTRSEMENSLTRRITRIQRTQLELHFRPPLSARSPSNH
jgi:hypothetical protein